MVKTFSEKPRFELLPDGTVYTRAGVQTNSGGIAGIHVRITPDPAGAITFTAVGGDGAQGDGCGDAVPGNAVPEPFREAIFSGAQQALDDLGTGAGVRFELIDALVHPVDANPAKFRRAAYTAMHGWLELPPV